MALISRKVILIEFDVSQASFKCVSVAISVPLSLIKCVLHVSILLCTGLEQVGNKAKGRGWFGCNKGEGQEVTV